MADIQVILEVVGVEDMERAARSTVALDRAIDSLSNKLNKGSSSNQRYGSSQNKVETSVENATKAINRHTSSVNKSTAAQKQMTAANTFASRKINETGMAMQQFGYQAGDFIVQVQSGTNAFVAFGQQATQLVGILPMFASKLNMSVGALIGISTGLGIAIPLLTAAGAAFMRTRSSADESTSGIKAFEEALESARETIRDTAFELDALFAGFSNTEEFALTRAVREAQAELDAAIEANVDPRAERSGIEAAEERLRLAREELQTYQDQEARKERLLELERLAKEEVEAQNEALRERDAAVQNILNFKEQELQSLRDQVALQLIANQFGEDSVAYANLKRQQEEEAYRVYLEQNGILGNNADEVIRAWRALQNAKGAADDVADAARDIGSEISVAVTMANNLASALSRAAAAGQARARQLAVTQAQIAAAQSGVSQEAAAARAGAEFDLSQAGADPLIAMAAGAIAESEARQLEQSQNILSELNAPSSGGGGGGGGGATGPTSIFPELQAQVEAAMQQTKAYEEEIKLLDFALDKGMITQERYNQAVAQAQEVYGQAADAATNYEDILLKMANTTSDALGDAMMSIVDGTKSASDAFGDMVQIILKKAFELLVVNSIMNAIFGTTGLDIKGYVPRPTLGGGDFANGGVFSGGSQVTAFANGGVVGSPTFFPMSNGGVGLMGEAGPEAIMPLKRGKGGRLGVEVSGEQGNVTIHQTFAFSANGDDSVKKIIAQEAPKIAALTQKQMLDARRRGGVVRDTFA